jgi:hypothetical protein
MLGDPHDVASGIWDDASLGSLERVRQLLQAYGEQPVYAVIMYAQPQDLDGEARALFWQALRELLDDPDDQLAEPIAYWLSTGPFEGYDREAGETCLRLHRAQHARRRRERRTGRGAGAPAQAAAARRAARRARPHRGEAGHRVAVDSGGAVRRRVGTHREPRGDAVKYVLLIYADMSGWAQRSEEERASIFDEYIALRTAPGVLGSNQLQPAATATVVRVEDGSTVTMDGPFVETKEQLGGYLLEADSLDDAIATAARIPAARLGGAVEVRALVQ